MSSPIAFLRRLLDAGMPLDMALTAAEAFEQEASIKVEMRRAKDRQRKRRASSVSAESAELPENAEETVSAESETPSLDKEIPPTPPKEINPTPLTPTNARATRELAQAAKDAAGDALADMAVCPGVASIARLTALLKGNPACDWDSDVLPAITSAAAWHRKRGGKGSMRSWETAAQIAVQNRDARLAGAPAKPKVAKPAIERDDDFWRAALRRWRADPSQWTPSMGPAPGEEGCAVPSHVLKETEGIRSAA